MGQHFSRAMSHQRAGAMHFLCLGRKAINSEAIEHIRAMARTRFSKLRASQMPSFRTTGVLGLMERGLQAVQGAWEKLQQGKVDADSPTPPARPSGAIATQPVAVARRLNRNLQRESGKP